MTTNEILLIIAVVVLLLLQTLYIKRVEQPLNTYINVAISVILLVLVWVFASDGSLPLKIIVTTFVIIGTIKMIEEYKAFTRKR